MYERVRCQKPNPLFKTPRSVCEEKGDYDCIDLTAINEGYMARSNYTIAAAPAEYAARNPDVYGKKYYLHPKLVSRKMLNLKQERTFNVALLPEGYGHINGLVGIAFKDLRELFICASSWASIPFDFYVKVMGKSNFNFAAAAGFPVLNSQYDGEIILRGLLLNAVNSNYSELYLSGLKFCEEQLVWSKEEDRLIDRRLRDRWESDTPLRTDYERRQALVEIDVLTAMAIGMSLDQLKTIYRLQFAVAQQYEVDTWYDANGRIVFTTNRSMVGVGYDRKTWEYELKDAPAGKKFYRKITDDTMPGGPVERTIEYGSFFFVTLNRAVVLCPRQVASRSAYSKLIVLPANAAVSVAQLKSISKRNLRNPIFASCIASRNSGLAVTVMTVFSFLSS